MSTPVRVAMVVGKMVGGGVESIVMSYIKHIDREKVHFTLLADSDSTCVPENEIIGNGAELIYIPPYSRQIIYQKTLYDIFREKQFDVVHSHINTLSVFPLFAAKRAGVPVRIAHSHSTSGKGERLKNTVKYMLRPFATVFPTKLCSCGEYAGRWLFGKNAVFDILPNNLDFESDRFAFDPSASEAFRNLYGIDKCLAVGHVGRFIPQKNHFFLIDIFAEIRKLRPDAFLFLAGQGRLEDAVRDKVRSLGIEDSVIFLGQISDIESFYSAMDVLLLPSLYEGKPLTAMEAQYASLPVVMSDRITGEAVLIPELVRKLPLEASSREWARQTVLAAGADRKRVDTAALKGNSTVSADELSDWYVGLCEEKREKDTVAV